MPAEYAPEPFLFDQAVDADQRQGDLEQYLGTASFASGTGVVKTSQTLTTGVVTTITFGSSDWSSTGIVRWDGSQTLTVRQAGLYTVTANASFAAGTLARFIGVIQNGSTELVGQTIAGVGGDVDRLSCSEDVPLNEGDALTLQALQRSGGNLVISNARLRVRLCGVLA